MSDQEILALESFQESQLTIFHEQRGEVEWEEFVEAELAMDWPRPPECYITRSPYEL